MGNRYPIQGFCDNTKGGKLHVSPLTQTHLLHEELSLVYTPVADCRWQSRGSATVADSRARVYTSAGDCRQRKWATVVSSRRL